jgi:hypothetical protein
MSSAAPAFLAHVGRHRECGRRILRILSGGTHAVVLRSYIGFHGHQSGQLWSLHFRFCKRELGFLQWAWEPK